MVTAIRETEPVASELTFLDIFEMVEREIEHQEAQGITDPPAAAALVLDRLIRDGLAEAVLRALGPRVILDAWKQGGDRARRPTDIKSAGVTVLAIQVADTGDGAIDGEFRTVNRVFPADGALSHPSALLEAIYKVGDRYVRLGDFDRATCERIASQYQEVARKKQRDAAFFRRLAERLGQGEHVKDRFDNASLLALRKAAA